MDTNKSNYWARLCLIAGLIASIFWIAADILIVGFVPHPEKYPLISETLSSQINTELALLALEGSPTRLKWGVLLATFTISLTLFSIYGVYKLMRPGKYARITIAFLFIGFSLAPLGHAGFLYTGIQSQAILNSSADNLNMQIENFNIFSDILKIHWASSISLTSIGWILFLIACIRGHTVLSKKNAIINPIILSIISAIIINPIKHTTIGAMIYSAGLNIALFIFFFAMLCITSSKEF